MDDLLDTLAEACSAVAHNNFDGSVEVEEPKEGKFIFNYFDEDSELASSLEATLVGTVAGVDVYRFTGNPVGEGVIMALVPTAIVGLLTL